MTWQDLVLTSDRPSRPSEDEGERPADVLLQVVLPIILILAFFAAISIRNYREEVKKSTEQAQAYRNELEDLKQRQQTAADLERERKKLDEKRGELSQAQVQLAKKQKQLEVEKKEVTTNQEQLQLDKEELGDWFENIQSSEKTELATLLSLAFLEIQKQKIVAAFEKVETKHRDDLGLLGMNQIHLRVSSSGRLEDGGLFIRLCKEGHAALGSDPAAEKEQQQIYARVLAAAGLSDLSSSTPDDSVGHTILESQRAQRDEITSENRKFLRELIEKLLADLRSDIVREELRVINTVFEFYAQAPLDIRYGWLPNLQGISSSIEDPENLKAAIRQMMYQQIRTDFRNQECQLLPEVLEHS